MINLKRVAIFFLLGVVVCSFWRDSEASSGIVKVCTWKDCHKGALSISIDDTSSSCFVSLTRNKFKGSYYVHTYRSWRLRFLNYPRMFTFYHLGHEIGSHTVNHPCRQQTAHYMRQEFEDNIAEIRIGIRVRGKDIISMAWPCGYVQHKDIAAEYFLSARGYNINELEDVTPADFMNLKSFNSHEHPPFPPSDLKVVLNEAEEQGKWAILVFHRQCNDDGAIDYAKTKDLWVAPIGTVIKYILQRDNIQVTNFQETSSQIRFIVSRPEIPPSRIRSFETAFHSGDEVTLKIDIDDARDISRVKVDGRNTPYKIFTLNNNKYLLLNTYIPSKSRMTIEIAYKRVIE